MARNFSAYLPEETAPRVVWCLGKCEVCGYAALVTPVTSIGPFACEDCYQTVEFVSEEDDDDE